MRLLYAFAEPLPIPRARGVQVAHSLDGLAGMGVGITLAYVPVPGKPPLLPTAGSHLSAIGMLPLSRGWPTPFDQIPPFSRWHSVRFFATRLVREIRRQKPEAVYVRHLKLAARLLASDGLPPLIYEAHEVFADTAASGKRRAIEAMEAEVMRGAAGVVCNSQATANRLVERYGPTGRLLVLPNGVTPQETLPEKPWNNCLQYVVYAGSFFGWKGVADLVAAAAELDGFHITLIGGEPDQIERLRNSLSGRGATIEILPRVPHPEVMARVAGACIAVLPNRPNPDSAFTSPIKLFEYMAAGCAVVASDLPSIREILGPDEAVWFEAGNSASLAAALRSIGSDCARAKAMGERLREKSAGYTWDGRARKLKAFLDEIIAAKSGPQ